MQCFVGNINELLDIIENYVKVVKSCKLSILIRYYDVIYSSQCEITKEYCYDVNVSTLSSFNRKCNSVPCLSHRGFITI